MSKPSGDSHDIDFVERSLRFSSDAVTDEDYMRLALEEARLAAEEGEVPIGAVVVSGGERVRVGEPSDAPAWGIRGGEVVARAHNRRETDRDPSAHAEFAAMTAAARALDRWRLTGCTVYVTLEPCLMCAGLMVNARIDRCVFGAPDPKGGALGTLYDVSHDERLNHEFEVTGGVLADECAAELRSFFRARRARKAKLAPSASPASAESTPPVSDPFAVPAGPVVASPAPANPADSPEPESADRAPAGGEVH